MKGRQCDAAAIRQRHAFAGDLLDEQLCHQGAHGALAHARPAGVGVGQQVLAELSARREAFVDVGVNGPSENFSQDRLELFPFVRHKTAPTRHLQDVVGRHALVEALVGEQLVAHHPAGKEVGAGVDGVPSRVLRCHVRHLAHDNVWLGALDLQSRCCEAEVDELDLTLEAHQHVLRADVAVHKVEGLTRVRVCAPVRIVESLQGLTHQVQRRRCRGCPLLLPASILHCAQIAARNVVHGQVVFFEVTFRRFGVDATDVEDVANVGVAEGDDDTGFVDEAGDVFPISGELGSKFLQYTSAFESSDAARLRQEDLAHAAPSEVLQKQIAPEGTGENFVVVDYECCRHEGSKLPHTGHIFVSVFGASMAVGLPSVLLGNRRRASSGFEANEHRADSDARAVIVDAEAPATMLWPSSLCLCIFFLCSVGGAALALPGVSARPYFPCVHKRQSNRLR